MRLGARMYRWGAVLPGIVLSTAVWLVVAAALPVTLGGLLLVGCAVAAAVLARGWCEGPAVRVLGRARRPTVGEQQLLEHLAGWLVSCGMPAPDLHVGRGDAGRAAAEPYGRRSVVVAPRMLRWLHRGQVSPEVAVAVVAQAAAGLEFGPSRFDLAVRLLTAPGALVVAGFLRVAGLFTWLPGVLGLWRIRGVFGLVAVWQCLQAHEVTIAVTTGTLVAVSYTAPACARAWRRRVEVDSDWLVAAAGLARQLEFAVRSADEPGSLDRVQRIRTAAAVVGEATAASHSGKRHLHVVR